MYAYNFDQAWSEKEKNSTNLTRFLYSKKKDPSYLSKDVSKVSKISRKRFLSFPYFLTRLRMRERQIEIKRISLSLSFSADTQ